MGVGVSAQLYKKNKKGKSADILANVLGVGKNIGVIMFYGYLVRKIPSRRTRLWRGRGLWI